MYYKKKSYILIIIGITMIISICKILFTTHDNIPAMSNSLISQTIEKDLNGDGIIDKLYITEKNEKYLIQALINDSIFALSEKKPINSLGMHYDFSPISINFYDLSRDKVPEIIIQSFENNIPIQHIFSFNQKEFIDIFCSTNNTLGILNTQNNQTPIYISFSTNDIDNTLQKNILNKFTPKNISFSDIQLDFMDPILHLINVICSKYELNYDYLLPEIHQTTFNYLNSLNLDKFSYGLLDIYFEDSSKTDMLDKFTFNIRLKQSDSKNNCILTKLSVTVNQVNEKYMITEIKANS